jgi:hypothetical protein
MMHHSRNEGSKCLPMTDEDASPYQAGSSSLALRPSAPHVRQILRTFQPVSGRVTGTRPALGPPSSVVCPPGLELRREDEAAVRPPGRARRRRRWFGGWTLAVAATQGARPGGRVIENKHPSRDRRMTYKRTFKAPAHTDTKRIRMRFNVGRVLVLIHPLTRQTTSPSRSMCQSPRSLALAAWRLMNSPFTLVPLSEPRSAMCHSPAAQKSQCEQAIDRDQMFA